MAITIRLLRPCSSLCGFSIWDDIIGERVSATMAETVTAANQREGEFAEQCGR